MSQGATVLGATGALILEFATTSRTPQLSALAIALVGAIVSAWVRTLQANHKDDQAAARETPENLRGSLHVIHRVVANHKARSDPPEGWLRITLHRVDGEILEQVVDYVGSSEGPERGAGRRFKIHAGLIGKAARTRKPCQFSRPPDMSFADWAAYLVEEQGLTREEAFRTRPDRFDFLGVPILDMDLAKCRAVVYLDSLESRFFDAATVAVVVAGVAGLARWIDEYYYRK